jgi:phage terminase small subunit
MATLVFIQSSGTTKKLLTFDRYGNPEAISFSKMLEYIDKQIIKMYCELYNHFTKSIVEDIAVVKIGELQSRLRAEFNTKILEANDAIIDAYDTKLSYDTGLTVEAPERMSDKKNLAKDQADIIQAKIDARLKKFEANKAKGDNFLKYDTPIELHLGSEKMYVGDCFFADVIYLGNPWERKDNEKWKILKV